MSATGANIAVQLSAVAARLPDKLAVIEGDRSWTFRELDRESHRLAHGLARAGLGRGTRVVLMVKPGFSFFALVFALFRTGAVPVMIDPGIGREHLGRCIAEAAPEGFIGIPLAHVARVLFRWGGSTLRVIVTHGRRWFWGGTTVEYLADIGRDRGEYPVASPDAKDVAAILFTSGSTGAPKGVVYTHGIFNAQVEMLSGHFGIRAEDVDLPTFPLFALFDAALGMTAVIPKMDFTRPGRVDPRAILEPIQRHKVTQMFGSPALLDRVGSYAARHGVQLPTLVRVLSAGAPVPVRVLETFSKALSPTAQVHTPYGATEALPVASIGSHEVLGETAERSARGLGTCVGRPLPNIEVSVIRITDEPIPAWSGDLLLPAGQVGEITVRGPVVTEKYHARPEATALAKIAAPDGSVYHRMGDLGYLDEVGRLWFCGRKAHRVITPAATLYTIPCEAVFNQHPAVRRTALVGVGQPGRMKPVLCVEPLSGMPGGTAADRLRSELLALGEKHDHTRGIRELLFHPQFPVDIRHNAKIFREKLADWASTKVGAA